MYIRMFYDTLANNNLPSKQRGKLENAV